MSSAFCSAGPTLCDSSDHGAANTVLKLHMANLQVSITNAIKPALEFSCLEPMELLTGRHLAAGLAN
jgi:hypothetical protein